MEKQIYYRHYEMKDRIQQHSKFPFLWLIIPMTTKTPVYFGVMDDFGSIVPIQGVFMENEICEFYAEAFVAWFIREWANK